MGPWMDIILRSSEFAQVTESLQCDGYLRQIREGLRACGIHLELPFRSCMMERGQELVLCWLILGLIARKDVMEE